jgi:hypothetical protein
MFGLKRGEALKEPSGQLGTGILSGVLKDVELLVHLLHMNHDVSVYQSTVLKSHL